MFHVTKLYPTQDVTVFHAFGRVISGTSETEFVSCLLPVFTLICNTVTTVEYPLYGRL